MPVFYNSKKNFLITTSYKVMYSTLYSQKSLEVISERRALQILLSRRFSKNPCTSYFLARNPYDRLLSFFTDKFRTHPIRYRDENFTWQACQKVFYPYLGLSTADRPKTIMHKLTAMKFSFFIDLLPKTYRTDGHTRPQKQSGYLRCYDIPYAKLWFDKVIRIDSDDLLLLSDRLSIDLQIRKNATQHKHYQQIYTRVDYEVVNHLYKEDFIFLGYKVLNN